MDEVSSKSRNLCFGCLLRPWETVISARDAVDPRYRFESIPEACGPRRVTSWFVERASIPSASWSPGESLQRVESAGMVGLANREGNVPADPPPTHALRRCSKAFPAPM
jgi:hypothetical protein